MARVVPRFISKLQYLCDSVVAALIFDKQLLTLCGGKAFPPNMLQYSIPRPDCFRRYFHELSSYGYQQFQIFLHSLPTIHIHKLEDYVGPESQNSNSFEVHNPTFIKNVKCGNSKFMFKIFLALKFIKRWPIEKLNPEEILTLKNETKTLVNFTTKYHPSWIPSYAASSFYHLISYIKDRHFFRYVNLHCKYRNSVEILLIYQQAYTTLARTNILVYRKVANLAL